MFAQNVFDVLAARWDVQMCGGGIRWQIKPENPGYEYKDSRTQGTFFQLAIRLARYTGNATYGQWAEKTFQWMSESGLLTAEGRVYDGLTVEGGSVQDCSLYGTQSESKYVWSVNNGLFLSGSALMYKIVSLPTCTKRGAFY